MTKALPSRQPRAPSIKARSAGFTLVELLVAITVLSIVAVLGWRGLDGIVRARVALTDQMEQTRGLQLAFAQMQSDCAQIPTDPNTIPNRLPLVVEPGRIVMVRKVHSENQPTRMQVVAYQLKNGTLMRRESTATRDLNALDSLWMAVTNENSGVPSVVLQTGLTAMAVRIWLNDGNGWRTPGIDVVPTTVTTTAAVNPANGMNATMPTGMEVVMQPRDRGTGMTKIFLLGAV